jgi:hypothetical protein
VGKFFLLCRHESRDWSDMSMIRGFSANFDSPDFYLPLTLADFFNTSQNISPSTVNFQLIKFKNSNAQKVYLLTTNILDSDNFVAKIEYPSRLGIKI